MKNRKNFVFGLGIFACALCCLLPIAGSVLGLTLLVSLAPWLEITSIILLGISLIGFLISYLVKARNKKGCSNACATDCSCKGVNLQKEERVEISNV
jgi:hypothetical protein